MPELALGIWLKDLRGRRDLSLREVAERSKVDHAYIFRLETGAKEAPSEDVIDKLVIGADAFQARCRNSPLFGRSSRTSTSNCSILSGPILRFPSMNSTCSRQS